MDRFWVWSILATQHDPNQLSAEVGGWNEWKRPALDWNILRIYFCSISSYWRAYNSILILTLNEELGLAICRHSCCITGSGLCPSYFWSKADLEAELLSNNWCILWAIFGISKKSLKKQKRNTRSWAHHCAFVYFVELNFHLQGQGYVKSLSSYLSERYRWVLFFYPLLL